MCGVAPSDLRRTNELLPGVLRPRAWLSPSFLIAAGILQSNQPARSTRGNSTETNIIKIAIKPIRKLALKAILFSCLSYQAHAATVTWTGGTLNVTDSFIASSHEGSPTKSTCTLLDGALNVGHERTVRGISR